MHANTELKKNIAQAFGSNNSRTRKWKPELRKKYSTTIPGTGNGSQKYENNVAQQSQEQEIGSKEKI